MSEQSSPQRNNRRRRNRRRSGGGRSSSKPKLNLDQQIRQLADLTPIQPQGRINLESDPKDSIGRLINMICPIGKGQRCLITSPPKAGKTTILHSIARAVHKNHPEIVQYALLIDERPEEATDFRRNVPVDVHASTSDMPSKNHIKVAEKVFNLALQQVLEGKDVLILLDSITRLARAYNNETSGGKILSGGVTAGALDRPRQLFGAARKIEEGGSLTIVATALVDTGSVMDEVIFQEFKGTGNMELILDRQLAQRRLFPAINVGPSGTRREQMMFNEQETVKIPALRRFLSDMGKEESVSWLLKRIRKTQSNKELLGSINTQR